MWDYAKLSAEASKLGGPAALRTAYKLAGRTKGLEKGLEKGLAIGLWAGRAQGVVVTAGVAYAGNAIYKTLRARSVVSADAQPAAEATAGTPAPGEQPDVQATEPPAVSVEDPADQ
ncbi:hypothetical protein [Streptomyces sp. NBC_00464]|uniref:hypothetical protein n=1 Tax=unclassified Streptomyces TaxID=2593676 RepID=UPI002E189C71